MVFPKTPTVSHHHQNEGREKEKERTGKEKEGESKTRGEESKGRGEEEMKGVELKPTNFKFQVQKTEPLGDLGRHVNLRA